jgi:hypothetical protein
MRHKMGCIISIIFLSVIDSSHFTCNTSFEKPFNFKGFLKICVARKMAGISDRTK